MNQFFNNLFGAIASNGIANRATGKDFIPGKKGKTIDLTGKTTTPVWLGLRSPLMQKYAYEFCFPVASVVDRLAEMDTNGCVEINRTKGKGSEQLATNAWAQSMNALLAQPNPLQSWAQFRGQQVMYKKIFGFCPVLPIIPTGFENQPWEATALINLPPWEFEAVGTGKIFNQSKIEGIIQEYRVSVLGNFITLKPNQIFILEDSYMQDELRNYLLPKSRLCGLDFAVSNICAAMEADNVILRRGGPDGVFSPDSKDGTGSSLPYGETELEELQQDLTKYGVTWSQFRFMISRNPLQFNAVGVDTKKLQTKETVVQGEKAVCHRFAFPYTLYEETEATYANGSNAAMTTYTDNVIPGNRKDIQKYNKYFQAAENSCKIEVDFDHLEVLQEDALNREKAAESQVAALNIEYENGIITKNQWLEARGYETIGPEGDKYKESVPQPTSQANGPTETSNLDNPQGQ